jgi:CubicO group peptidase (beta-lactamase class C family)
MVRNSLTLLGNDLRLIPVTNLDKRKIAILSIGDTSNTLITATLAKYAPLSIFRVPANISDSVIIRTFNELKPFDLVIAILHGISSSPGRNYGITPSMQKLTDTVSGAFRTIVALLGTPYAINSLKTPKKAEALIVAYQDNDNTQRATAEAIFGGSPISGRLPVSTNAYSLKAGAETNTTRLGSALPASLFPFESPEKVIDSLVNDGISSKAFPGCQVMLAKDGRIFFDKAYGNPQYGDSLSVTTDYLYDLASVTKVAATTLAVMKLFDQNKIRLNDTLGKFLEVCRHTNKSSLKIGEILAHEAGLQDWIPFYRETLHDGVPDTSFYSTTYSDKFPVKVAEKLFISQSYKDSIVERILDSPLKGDKSYKYSDLGFILLKMVVEKVSGVSFQKFLEDNFYRPLGLTTLTFNPLEKFPIERICPTEFDQEFRNQLIRGYVHDPAAAMLGGISGHAGLFGTSRDLAVVLQMLLNKGEYGGNKYLSAETVDLFTRTYDPPQNRRGLGFDKPPMKNDPGGPVCSSASPLSYGHSGFTGTYIWADPANNLLYVFLSNRVCPDANNQKLSMMNIRTNIHQAVYDHLRKISAK